MEDETIESVNVEEPLDTSDEGLDAAFLEFMEDGTIEPEPVEEVEEPAPQQAPDVPSRLGRKVARLERNMASKEDIGYINSQIQLLMSKLDTRREPSHDDFGEEIERPVDIEKKIDERLNQREMERQARAMELNRLYETNYLSTMRTLLEEVDNSAMASDIWKMMTDKTSEFNTKLSDNPFTDAAKNFARASKAALRKSRPFDKEKPTLPSGVSHSSNNSAPAKKTIKLDKEAEEFIKATGMSQEDVDKALSGDMPARLRGKG